MRKIVSLAVLAVTALAGVAIAPTAASAASCYASSCSGKHPEDTGCAADAITAKSKTYQGRILELRYSPTCRSAWARVRNGHWNDYFEVNSSSGERRGSHVGYNQTSGYTFMVNDAGYFAYACTTNFNPNTCTGTY
jgi:hypothetical protein